MVGNPPFLGDKRMRSELGAAYVDCLRREYKGRVPGGADLVLYWFEKARAQIEAGCCQAAGLVATNSIRGGANRKVLDRITETTRIFEAWSDEPWVNEGAAVRVSLVGFGPLFDTQRKSRLDGVEVTCIYADLSAADEVNLTRAAVLAENRRCAYIGGMKKGSFDVEGQTARAWLQQGGNPNGRPNSDVLRPWVNGLDITRRPSDTWIIDFGSNCSLDFALSYEAPFQHVIENVKPAREHVNNALEKERWWLHARSAPDLRSAIEGLPRFMATARVAKHRLFVWLRLPVVCDGQVVVIARSDDTTFGILHSRFHELWALHLGTSLEDRPRYTPTTTFETFPFPTGMSPTDTAAGAPGGPAAEAIAASARRLVELRDNWLNPADWVERVPEIVPGYPDRLIPRPGHEAELKKRTLTNLYNQRPAWLVKAHQALDAAVAT
ncbi:DNA methyltransferase [Zoogloea sp.]|uniref:DNA methyltransferase n=1 Tax=Zoogloea sp. TaxID=49181 RepID=UPI0035B4ADF5